MILFTGVVLGPGGRVPAPGGGLVPGGCLVPGGGMPAPGWVPGRGGCLLLGGAWWRSPPTATAAGGTHPTGFLFKLIS